MNQNIVLELWTIKDGDFYGIELRLAESFSRLVEACNYPYYRHWEIYPSKTIKTYRQETFGL